VDSSNTLPKVYEQQKMKILRLLMILHLTLACNGFVVNQVRLTSLRGMIPKSNLSKLGISPKKTVPKTLATVTYSKGQTAIAGKIIPLLSKFKLNSKKLKRIGNALSTEVDPSGFVLLVVLGWTSIPISKRLFNFLQRRYESNELARSSGKNRTVIGKIIKAIAPPSYKRKMNFEDSLIFQVGNHISQLSKLGSLVYVSDVFAIIFREMGFVKFAHTLHQTFGPTTLTIWLAWRLNVFKRFLLSKRFRLQSSDLGRIEVWDRILSLLLYLVTGLVLLDRLSAKIGIALTSLFAFGGVGTLVVSLASKDLAAELLNGIALATSDKFYVGDSVKFGDGTSGSIAHIGWMYTQVKASDESIVKIPNSQIAHQRVTNLSRVPKCQVKETLRFNYADIDKIPKLVQDIKIAMKREFAEELIVDGTRPFHVHWLALEHDHLQVMCDFRFDMPPIGTAYLDLKQRVIMTLVNTVKKNDMEFALPNLVSRNLNMSPKFVDDFYRNYVIPQQIPQRITQSDNTSPEPASVQL